MILSDVPFLQEKSPAPIPQLHGHGAMQKAFSVRGELRRRADRTIAGID
jgi:hypothetical protein